MKSHANEPIFATGGTHLLSGEIDYECADEVIHWILDAGSKSSHKLDHLTLMICTHGGDLYCAFAIIDAIRSAPLPVHTVGIGQVSSGGLMILMAGAPGHRLLTPNTVVVSHQWAASWDVDSKQHELLASRSKIKIVSAMMLRHYGACTGLPDTTIKRKLLPPHDVFLDANQARALRLCDRVAPFHQS